MATNPYNWLTSDWWQQAKQYYPTVPETVLAPIVQSESGGNPAALGDYWNPQTKRFEQNPALGAPTSYGLFQLHTPGGQGDGHPISELLDPVSNARIAATAILPAYEQAKAQGYTGFDLVYRTARLSGHTIPRESLERNYNSYLTNVAQTKNVPTSASAAERSLPSGAGEQTLSYGTGLENALLSTSQDSNILTRGASLLFGTIIAVLLIGIGLWLMFSPNVATVTQLLSKGEEA